jgi:hypothetical protein
MNDRRGSLAMISASIVNPTDLSDCVDLLHEERFGRRKKN